MARKRLTIIVGERDSRLSIPSLVTALEDTVGILRDIDAEVSGADRPVLEWCLVAARMGSPFVATLESLPTGADIEAKPEVLRPFLSGMREIEQGATYPRYFTVDALVRAKRIVALRDQDVAYIEYSAPDEEPVRPTQHLAAHVDELIGSRAHAYEVLTELEGRLETISIHGRPDFCIYDAITDQPIRCVFPEDQLERVADLIKRRARVRVLGKARYNPQDRPVSVEVEAFDALPEQSELPQIEDLHRAEIDITGGQDSVEYVRGLRDAR